MLDIIIPYYFLKDEIVDDWCEEFSKQSIIKDVNLIFVNDASDYSADKVLSKIKQIPAASVRIITSPENCGPGNARNLGIDAATSDFIMFWDADDYIEDDFFLEDLIKNFDSPAINYLNFNVYSKDAPEINKINSCYRRSYFVESIMRFPTLYKEEDTFVRHVNAFHINECKTLQHNYKLYWNYRTQNIKEHLCGLIDMEDREYVYFLFLISQSYLIIYLTEHLQDNNDTLIQFINSIFSSEFMREAAQGENIFIPLYYMTFNYLYNTYSFLHKDLYKCCPPAWVDDYENGVVSIQKYRKIAEIKDFINKKFKKYNNKYSKPNIDILDEYFRRIEE